MNSSGISLLSCPTPYQVFQRDEHGFGNIAVKLDVACVEVCLVECYLKRSGKKTPAAYKISLGNDETVYLGVFSQVIVGDYDLEILAFGANEKILWKKIIIHVAVGDIYVLAGQSNMEGVGKLINTEIASSSVRCFYLDDEWRIAKDPLCWFNEAVDPIHWRVPEKERAKTAEIERYFRNFGAGLGISFGKEMYRYNQVPVGLLMSAHGGTSMEQWDPREMDKEGYSLYGSMLRRIASIGGKVKAILWYQGESDAVDQVKAEAFKLSFIYFIEALRRDIEQPDLPILFAQLNTWLGDSQTFPKWNSIQTDQLAIEEMTSNAACISTIDLSLSDAIHLETASLKRLGKRFSLLVRIVCFDDNQYSKGPRPIVFEFMDANRKFLKITFDFVNKGLSPNKDIRGFQIEHNGMSLPIMECRLDNSKRNVVLLIFKDCVPIGCTLWYGKGFNPVCSLLDGADMAVPVFNYFLE